ncbi:hypothetical protein [Glycomyces rhizosphaerae]|uniref:Uncharacterized protein n=1 Tax=Glycomyces rhizosphaerae TaxID=2054422 RepID=A0ABV7PYJ1_9ACTN
MPTRRLVATLGGPFAETAEHWITTGLDEDLDERTSPKELHLD